jgi:hypothetical protein
MFVLDSIYFIKIFWDAKKYFKKTTWNLLAKKIPTILLNLVILILIAKKFEWMLWIWYFPHLMWVIDKNFSTDNLTFSRVSITVSIRIIYWIFAFLFDYSVTFMQANVLMVTDLKSLRILLISYVIWLILTYNLAKFNLFSTYRNLNKNLFYVDLRPNRADEKAFLLDYHQENGSMTKNEFELLKKLKLNLHGLPNMAGSLVGYYETTKMRKGERKEARKKMQFLDFYKSTKKIVGNFDYRFQVTFRGDERLEARGLAMDFLDNSPNPSWKRLVVIYCDKLGKIRVTKNKSFIV